jgi:hypothetical protein
VREECFLVWLGLCIAAESYALLPKSSLNRSKAKGRANDSIGSTSMRVKQHAQMFCQINLFGVLFLLNNTSQSYIAAE